MRQIVLHMQLLIYSSQKLLCKIPSKSNYIGYKRRTVALNILLVQSTNKSDVSEVIILFLMCLIFEDNCLV